MGSFYFFQFLKKSLKTSFAQNLNSILLSKKTFAFLTRKFFSVLHKNENGKNKLFFFNLKKKQNII
jgi:hypothetical protein